MNTHFLVIFISFAFLLVGCLPSKNIDDTQRQARDIAEAPEKGNVERRKRIVTKIQVVEGLSRPFGIQLDKEGNMYIADFDAHRIVRYNRDLVFTGWLGAMPDGRTDGWQKEGRAIAGSVSGAFTKPHSIDFDDTGNFYVADYGNERVQKFTRDGRFITKFGSGFIGAPASAYFGRGGYLYVADNGLDRVLKYNNNGEYIGWVGGKFDGTVTNGWETGGRSVKIDQLGGFNKLHMARFDSQGNMYVVDTWNHRIQKFTQGGLFLGWLGAKADGSLTHGWEKTGTAIPSSQPGAFHAPVALDFDEQDNFIVAEYGNPRIQLFSREGFFLGWLGGKEDGTVTQTWEREGEAREGQEQGAFSHPYDVKSEGNTLYVADTHNNRIQLFVFRE